MKGMIKLIVFDFDGTLGDTRAHIFKTMRDTLQILGLPMVTDEAIAATIGIPLGAGFEQLFPGLNQEEILHCMKTYREIFEKNKSLFVPVRFPGVKRTLAGLKERGYILSVASSRLSRSLNELLQALEIAGYISYVLGADNVEKAKPDPEPVLKTLREMGYDARETLVVGDMPVDILMGARAGAHTCAVTWGNASRTDLEHAGADYIIDKMEDVFRVVESIGLMN